MRVRLCAATSLLRTCSCQAKLAGANTTLAHSSDMIHLLMSADTSNAQSLKESGYVDLICTTVMKFEKYVNRADTYVGYVCNMGSLRARLRAHQTSLLES